MRTLVTSPRSQRTPSQSRGLPPGLVGVVVLAVVLVGVGGVTPVVVVESERGGVVVVVAMAEVELVDVLVELALGSSGAPVWACIDPLSVQPAPVAATATMSIAVRTARLNAELFIVLRVRVAARFRRVQRASRRLQWRRVHFAPLEARIVGRTIASGGFGHS